MSVAVRIYPAEWQYYIPPQERDWRDVPRERANHQHDQNFLPSVNAKEFFASLTGSAYEELAGEIDRGKYRKAYEVYPALGRALEKRLAEVLKNDEQK